MKTIASLIRNRKVKIIVCFLFIAALVFLILCVLGLSRWSVNRGEFKLIVRTKGLVNNLTITEWIYYFNASTGNIPNFPGINIETYSSSDKNSRVEIDFQNCDSELVVIVLSSMEPMCSAPIDRPYNFTLPPPQIEGSLENFTGFFFHFSISAVTPIGLIDIYTYSVEAVVTHAKLEWGSTQTKEMTATVFIWGSIFLSAGISSICVTAVSFLFKKEIYQSFPVVTLFLSSAMCFVYLFAGVGDDLLSAANANLESRLTLFFFSCFFHFNYYHLMDNLLYGFVIGGSLIEMWLPKWYGLRRYLWYFSPVPVSILFSAPGLFVSSFLSLSSGASLWIIGIAIVLALSIFRNRNRLQMRPVWDVTISVLIGYLFVSVTWNYVANLLINHDSQEALSSFVVHAEFAVVFSVVAVLFILFRKVLGRPFERSSDQPRGM